MKNKKFTYILLFLALVVWGVIFYRIFGALGDQEKETSIQDIKIGYKEIAKNEKASIILIADYRDPFLGKAAAPIRRKPSVSVIPADPVSAPIAAPFYWPNISYLGIIENKKKGSKVALIQMESQEFFLSENESANNLKVLKILKDSVKVSFQGEVKYFKKLQK